MCFGKVGNRLCVWTSHGLITKQDWVAIYGSFSFFFCQRFSSVGFWFTGEFHVLGLFCEIILI